LVERGVHVNKKFNSGTIPDDPSIYQFNAYNSNMSSDESIINVFREFKAFALNIITSINNTQYHQDTLLNYIFYNTYFRYLKNNPIY